MLALSPPCFPTFLWPLEEPIIHDIDNFFIINNNDNNNLNMIQTSDDSPNSKAQIGLSESAIFGSSGGDVNTVKKLNHNAGERDRRKRINSMYSFLFSLLPSSEQTKKLSIPATVSRVVKYIPELQKEIEELEQKKNELSLKMINSRTQNDNHSISSQKNKRKYSNFNSDGESSSTNSSVSITEINFKEIMIQISTIKSSIFEALQILEENGLILLNASSFQSFGLRIFHNLHFQVQGNDTLDTELLRQKLLLFFKMSE